MTPLAATRPIGAALLAWLCHAEPDRCLTIGGWTLPICARCTGLYGGLLAAAAANLFALKLRPTARVGGLAVALVLLGAAEVGAEQLGWPGSNAVRLASGLIMGVGIGTLIGVGLRTLLRPPADGAAARGGE